MSLKTEIKKTTGRTQFKKSTYMSIFVIVVIAIVIVVNIFANNLSDTITELDVSQNKIFNIGDTTREMLSNLDKDVELIVIAEDGSVDSRIEHFLSIYDAASDHIKITYKDPALYPSVLTTYNTTSDTIVVKCEDTDKSEIIDFNNRNDMDNGTYSDDGNYMIVYNQMYYSYYGSLYETEWDGEGQLTSAINYVASDNENTVYQLGGHGETALGDTITSLIGKSNINISSWTLMTDGDIPEDCSTIIINEPTSDISAEELTSLQDYLASGGNILIVLGTDMDSPNLDTLMASYGISQNAGYIGDNQRYNSYDQTPFSSFPEYSSGSITGDLNDNSDLTLVRVSGSISITDVDGVTVDPFLVTTSEGIYYEEGNDGYETGTYTYAATATKDEDADADGNAVTSTLTVYACAGIVDETLLTNYTGLANGTVFVNSLTAYYDGVENVSIDTVSLETNYNTIENGQPVFVLVVILVIALVVIGIVRWVRRRRL